MLVMRKWLRQETASQSPVLTQQCADPYQPRSEPLPSLPTVMSLRTFTNIPGNPRRGAGGGWRPQDRAFAVVSKARRCTPHSERPSRSPVT